MAPLSISQSNASGILGVVPCSLPFRYNLASPDPPPRPEYAMAMWVQRPWANGVRSTTTNRLLKSGFLSEGAFAGFQALSAPNTPQAEVPRFVIFGEIDPNGRVVVGLVGH